MNGSEIKAVIDTNVIFMALYDANSKAARLIKAAMIGKIKLFSTDTAKEEIFRVLERELSFCDEEIETIIKSLPISWVKKEIYESFLHKTKVKHKVDKPLEALSIVLGCGILSADTHFKNRVSVNELLAKLE